MSASINDKITDVRNAARPVSTTVSSGRSAGGATLSCGSLLGWPTASKVHFVTYKIDSNSNPVAGSQLDCYGIVSGSDIGSFTVVDGTDTGHAIGDVVEMLPTAAWGQGLADALIAQHSRTGAHAGISNTGGLTTDTLTVTSGSTFPAGDIGTADLANASVTANKLSTGASSAYVATAESTSSTSYAALATPGPTVTVTVGVNGLLLVTLGANINNNTGGNVSTMGFDLSGANTLAAADKYSISLTVYLNNYTVTVGNMFLLTGLTPGSTTVTAKYSVGNGGTSGTFTNRNLAAVPL